MDTDHIDFDSLLKAFGQAVRDRRESLGLSQEQLALRCGLHRTYVGDVERGVRNPSLKAILRLSKGLETAPAILLANLSFPSDESRHNPSAEEK